MHTVRNLVENRKSPCDWHHAYGHVDNKHSTVCHHSLMTSSQVKQIFSEATVVRSLHGYPHSAVDNPVDGAAQRCGRGCG